MSADYPKTTHRPPHTTRPSRPPLTHCITIGSEAVSLPLPFPDPADFWQSRDITSQDWAAFASDITAALTEDGEALDDQKQVEKDAYHKKRVNEILAAWNSRFFERRGLTVVVNGTGAGSFSDGTSRFSFGPDKFGIKIGSGIFGVDLSSKTPDPKK
ncbi:hypothetical protein ColKHC_07794 [Colletotrichum higginsianum]|nr:hypothetical protein ColKHC_07794 [Colletotrichum higginsianum]